MERIILCTCIKNRGREGEGCMPQAPKPVSGKTFVDEVKDLKTGRLFMYPQGPHKKRSRISEGEEIC